jgi:hypothetical protein
VVKVLLLLLLHVLTGVVLCWRAWKLPRCSCLISCQSCSLKARPWLLTLLLPLLLLLLLVAGVVLCQRA